MSKCLFRDLRLLCESIRQQGSTTAAVAGVMSTGKVRLLVPTEREADRIRKTFGIDRVISLGSIGSVSMAGDPAPVIVDDSCLAAIAARHEEEMTSLAQDVLDRDARLGQLTTILAGLGVEVDGTMEGIRVSDLAKAILDGNTEFDCEVWDGGEVTKTTRRINPQKFKPWKDRFEKRTREAREMLARVTSPDDKGACSLLAQWDEEDE